jgi:TonB family protein
MRWGTATIAVLILCAMAPPKKQQPAPAVPSRFEIGRHWFFDFGPPFNYYELFIVRPASDGTSIERITLSPPGDPCLVPAKLEIASGLLDMTVPALFAETNPCAIPEKYLHRELKRCKKCLVFSGANVAMRVHCGSEVRVIRSDILDKDLFAAALKTPEYTSWTMQLLAKLDHAVGPGVMEKPMFSTPEKNEPSGRSAAPAILQDLAAGKFDDLFQGARDKPSELYRTIRDQPLQSTVRLDSSFPFAPEVFVAPEYPLVARTAHVVGSVSVRIDVDEDGNVINVTTESGPEMLLGAVKTAVGSWKFPKNPTLQHVRATIDFASNCDKPPSTH